MYLCVKISDPLYFSLNAEMYSTTMFGIACIHWANSCTALHGYVRWPGDGILGILARDDVNVLGV